MQSPNWNDFRYLLAVRRGQTLRAAAHQLHVDDTTVARRLAALERSVGQKLVQRRGDGKLMLTQAGELAAREADAIDRHISMIAESVSGVADAYLGTVRLTAVPILANRLFAGCFRDLSTKHPKLVVELIPDGRDYSLTRREADVAVRLARPISGGMNIKAWRIGSLAYATYVSSTVTRREARTLPWIAYEDSMAHLPQARWIDREVRGGRASVSTLRVRDAETALEATAAGIGRTLLPVKVAAEDSRLSLCEDAAESAYPAREIWLLAHADQAGLPQVKAVLKWVESAMQGSQRPSRQKG